MNKHLIGALLAGATCIVTPAFAADSSAPGAAATSDDIIVTARRKDESLEKVPEAITAFNAQALEARQIRSDADLQLNTPGLTIRQTQGNNSLSYSIRGQTADTFSGSPSAVIAYLNEVPLTVGSAQSFYDLGSVQVLKGPQGTLFGRNATGGAVLFTSAQPTDKVEAMVQGRVGSMAMSDANGMINMPFADGKVLLRAAFDVSRRGGYIFNTFNNQWLGQVEHNSGRLSLTLKPTDTISNTTIFQYSGSDGTNTGASYVWSIYQAGQTNNGIALNSNSSFLYPYVAAQRTLGYYKTDHPGDARNHGTDWDLSNTTTDQLGDDLTLKNIFGATRSNYNSVQPQLGAPYVTIATYNALTGQVGNTLKVSSISDELQLQGKAMDGKLSYIVGAYFQWQTTDTIWPQTYFLSPPYPPTFGSCPAPAACITNAFREKDATKAIYTQATYDLSSVVENLKFTAGARYTWDDLNFSQIDVPGNLNIMLGAQPEAHNYADPSWEAGLEYQANPETLAYVKTRGSFRAGGFNGARIPATPGYSDDPTPGNEFKSEHTQDVEAGLKYHGPLLGVPTTINIDAFNQWVQDVQRVEFPAGGAITVNVPSEIVQGVEGDVNIKASHWLELGWQAAYVRSRYPNGHVVADGNAYLYGPVGDTPRLSGTVYAQVALPVAASAGEVSLRGELYGQSGQYFSNEASGLIPDTFLPGYVIVNGRLGWDHIFHTGLSAALFGKNIGNRGYFVGGMPLGGVLGHNSADVGEPRSFGVELTARY
jgi:iron complex outermembrane receptor protein